MQNHYYRFCISPRACSQSGQALIWILLILGVSTLAIAAISRVALWKLDASIALISQRKLVENWEVERVEIIKSAFPTSTFKRINFANNQLVIPIVPKNISSIDSIRIPTFEIGDIKNPLFNWHTYLNGGVGSCAKLIDQKCSELNYENGKTLFFGDLDLAELKIPAGVRIVVATGDISIGSLKILTGGSVEIFSGFDLVVGEIAGEADSTIFMNSAHGRVKLTKTDAIDCVNLPQVRIGSKYPIQLKKNVVSSSGCSTVGLSPNWQNLRYLGDLPQKLLNY